jgi:N-glycosylase/DNA lyase
LCQEYGEKVSEYGGEEFYSFPRLERLAQPGVEDRLRQLGFGYRAKYIQVRIGLTAV